MSDSSALPVSAAAGEPNDAGGPSDPSEPVGDAGGPAGDDEKEPGRSGKEGGGAREPAQRGDPWDTFPFKRYKGFERRLPSETSQVQEEGTAGAHEPRQ